jgi:7,8-dihydropterin-6-yl-methyl-4-(beta-D-ribofuranosyl)aminobenzene 5'-phosphate synthase
MPRGLNRREFLETTAAAGAIWMAGGVLKNAGVADSGPLEIPEVEQLVITVITDNYYDCLRPNDKVAKRHFIIPGTSIHSEHGLAYHIETVVKSRPHAFLFDFGLDFHGVGKNMDLLNIDMKKVEALGLSHGHFDHWGSLIAILKSYRADIRQGLPLYVGEEAFCRRFANLPAGAFEVNGMIDLGQLRRDEIDSLDVAKIVEIKEPTMIVPGAYLTGNIERVTEYEKGSPMLLIKREGEIQRDHFAGEQSLVFDLKGKGLVLVSSCAHAGIVNTIKHAQKMTGAEKVHAVIGGFHLSGARPEVIQRTIADIKAISPEYIAPMHCTGFEAVAAFQQEMPGQVIINTAGTRYVFTA